MFQCTDTISSRSTDTASKGKSSKEIIFADDEFAKIGKSGELESLKSSFPSVLDAPAEMLLGCAWLSDVTTEIERIIDEARDGGNFSVQKHKFIRAMIKTTLY